MKQPALFDAVPALPPFQGKTAVSREASRSGAEVARHSAESQMGLMLKFYGERGPMTDLQMKALMVAALGRPFPESRVSARRSMLRKQGLVREYAKVMGPFGAMNTRWGLRTR